MTLSRARWFREQLLDRIWGGNVYVEERTIDVHIRRLLQGTRGNSVTIAWSRPSGERGVPLLDPAGVNGSDRRHEPHEGRARAGPMRWRGHRRIAPRSGRCSAGSSAVTGRGSPARSPSISRSSSASFTGSITGCANRPGRMDPAGWWAASGATWWCNVVRLHRRRSSQAARHRAAAGVPPLHRHDAGRGGAAESPGEIIWISTTRAGEFLGLRRKTDYRIGSTTSMRHPDFSRFLTAVHRPVVLRPKVGEDVWLSFQAVPYGDGQILLLVRDVSRQAGSEPCAGLRRQRLARTALAADRDRRATFETPAGDGLPVDRRQGWTRCDARRRA